MTRMPDKQACAACSHRTKTGVRQRRVRLESDRPHWRPALPHPRGRLFPKVPAGRRPVCFPPRPTTSALSLPSIAARLAPSLRGPRLAETVADPSYSRAQPQPSTPQTRLARATDVPPLPALHPPASHSQPNLSSPVPCHHACPNSALPHPDTYQRLRRVSIARRSLGRSSRAISASVHGMCFLNSAQTPVVTAASAAACITPHMNTKLE